MRLCDLQANFTALPSHFRLFCLPPTGNKCAAVLVRVEIRDDLADVIINVSFQNGPFGEKYRVERGFPVRS